MAFDLSLLGQARELTAKLTTQVKERERRAALGLAIDTDGRDHARFDRQRPGDPCRHRIEQ